MPTLTRKDHQVFDLIAKWKEEWSVKGLIGKTSAELDRGKTLYQTADASRFRLQGTPYGILIKRR